MRFAYPPYRASYTDERLRARQTRDFASNCAAEYPRMKPPWPRWDADRRKMTVLLHT